MGHGFGHLAKVYGIITYRLSPHELKTFKGFFSEGLPNLARRFRANVFHVAPPGIIAYSVYEYGEAEFARLQRKNPADYENDV